jgi:hypothetical protein
MNIEIKESSACGTPLEFYGKPVFPYELESKIQTYNIELFLQFKFDYLLEEIVKKNIISNHEVSFYFYATCDLTKYLKNDNQFDLYKLVKKFGLKEFETAVERLNKINLPSKPEIVYYKNEDSDWLTGCNIFLEFDNTADKWAGPFAMNGKKGCLAAYGKNISDNILTALNNQYYEMIKNTQEKLDYYVFCSINIQEKMDIFNKLSFEDQYKITESLINSLDIESFKPYKINLFGSDDVSYTKWFFTEKDMLNEVDKLLKLQPLNFQKDVIENGFQFTN